MTEGGRGRRARDVGATSSRELGPTGRTDVRPVGELGTPDDSPTPPQMRVLRLLVRLEGEGRPPTYREVAATLGWKAVGTARDHVRALARRGLVARSRSARGLRLTDRGRERAARAPADLRQLVGRLQPPEAREALLALAPYLRRRHWDAGATLWQEGESAGLVVAVLRGRVKIYRTLPNGTPIMLYVFGPGEVFGFLPLLDGGPYPASAQALDRVETLVFSRAELLAALRANPRLAVQLFGFLGRRLREAFNQIERLSTRGALQRVAASLVALLPEREGPGGLTIITLPLPAGELAPALGLTAESLSRAVTQLVSSHVLHRLGPRRLQVLDPAALREASRPRDL